MTTSPSGRSLRGTQFPIVEAYGFPYNSNSVEAYETWEAGGCPFAELPCEKKKQYGYGYCSVTYAAKWDKKVPHTYAVCDHRLDGDPINWAIEDHFGDLNATLVREVAASTKATLNVDFVAYRDEEDAEEGANLIAIEAQAIDLRGGGVGPAWQAWEENNVSEWRSYFSIEAAKKKTRKDTVDYGVNTGNVYKRLGIQIVVKGEYFRQIHVPLYVVTQHRILEQLRERVDFELVADDEPWDITFVGFDYDGSINANGQLGFSFVEAVRTTLPRYLKALTTSAGAADYLRSDFISKVRRKAGK